MALIKLPQEIISNVLSFLEPSHIVRFGQTGRTAHELISPSNQILWRSAFLQIYDHPEHAWSQMPASYPIPSEGWDWYLELRRRQRALRALYRRQLDWSDSEDEDDHVHALLSIIDTAKSAPTSAELARGKSAEVDDRSSLNLQLLANPQAYFGGIDRLIHDASAKGVPTQSEESCPGRPMTRSRAMAARHDSRSDATSRLHILHGLTTKERADHKIRGQARRKVYDWNLTSEDTDFGPFLPDGSGRVNWALLEGAVSTIYHNFQMCVDGHLALPNGFCYAIPYRTLIPSNTPHDWARVEGSWLGTYAFLDYAHLLAFNGGIIIGPTRPNLDDDPEACGDLLRMELKIDDSIKGDRRLKSNVPMEEDPDYPVLYFKGLSRGQGFTGNPTTAVKGFAALLPGGREVRWKFIIAYNGSDQWQLEGVQPGGIRSGGVFGMWSGVDHEPGGAIGPFCYFPMELCKPTSIVLAGQYESAP